MFKVVVCLLALVAQCLADERLLSFVMQENCFDYGATGHSGGLRHWESQLFRLETVAEFLQRRLVLLPPALILDPKHLFGDVTHGWSLLYNRSFDDPRFRTWEDIMTTRGQMTREVINVRSTTAMSQLDESKAELVVLRQCAVPGSAAWDQAPLVQVNERTIVFHFFFHEEFLPSKYMLAFRVISFVYSFIYFGAGLSSDDLALGTGQLHRSINGPGRRMWFGARTGQAAPPPPSYYVTAMGDRIVKVRFEVLHLSDLVVRVVSIS